VESDEEDGLDSLSDEEAESARSQSSIDEDEDLPSQSEPEAGTSESGQVEETSTIPAKAPEAPEDLSSALRKSLHEDHKKGKAVSRQIVRVL
jgi:protein AATF/BFR2